MKDWLNKARKWPVEKKKTFSISIAIFLTIIIIIFNSVLNWTWKNETKNILFTENSPFVSMKKSFSDIFNTAKPVFDRAMASSAEIIDQINAATSSLSSTSDIVE